MSELAAKRRGLRWWFVAIAVGTAVVGAGETAGAQQVRPSTVFDVSPSLAIEAARTRLRLFANVNPETADGSVPADLPDCPLISVEALNGIAGTVASERAADLTLQLDPWLGRTTSDPELRPDSAAAGEVQGIPIVRCDTNRPGDGEVTRPAMFAIDLNAGVTFGDVVRLYALQSVVPIQPVGIGGRQVGGCLRSDTTGVCVALWSSRDLVVGLTLEGPPSAVNTSTAGATLTSAVPTVINSLAVVTQPAPVCSADVIGAQTGIALIGEPVCSDGWAFGTTVECPPPTTTSTSTTTTEVTDQRLARGLRSPAVVPLQDCPALDVFHIESAGWVYSGSVDVSCTENLTRLGMTVVTAQEFAPQPCDDGDPSLDVGTIRPDRESTRVAALQIALVNLGYVLPVDGRYGPLTEAAVVDFQERSGLIIDGIAGRQTQAALGI